MRRLFASSGRSYLAALTVALLCAVLTGVARGDNNQPAIAEQLSRFKSFSVFPSAASWEKTVPQVKTIRIRSSMDGSAQPALYYDSKTDQAKPLLVVLHSWSDNYRQKYSIPYGLWAVANDWVFIHPDYRGIFDDPAATGSALAVQDIVDAVDYALENARIDPNRIYLTGFSGGAMMALNMAGKYPERWSAVAAWVPIYDLVDWYRYVVKFPGRHYARHIAASCGGKPREGSKAADECRKRSPSAHLKNARGRNLPIYLAHGVHDDIAPPEHSVRVFNELADPKDVIALEDIERTASKGEIPTRLAYEHGDKLYGEAGKPLLMRKSSGSTTISLFKGGHDVLYLVGLQWLSAQSGERKANPENQQSSGAEK